MRKSVKLRRLWKKGREEERMIEDEGGESKKAGMLQRGEGRKQEKEGTGE